MLLSAGLHGACVMVSSAVLSVWSLRQFPGLASTSFTAALLAHAAGSVVAPALTGLAAAQVGLGPVFLAWALLPLSTALLSRVLVARARRGCSTD